VINNRCLEIRCDIIVNVYFKNNLTLYIQICNQVSPGIVPRDNVCEVKELSCGVLYCDTVQYCRRIEVFRRNMMRSSSSLKCPRTEIGPVMYSRLQGRRSLRPAEVVTQTHGGWAIRPTGSGLTDPWEVGNHTRGKWSLTPM
jgi:hypothetical protein